MRYRRLNVILVAAILLAVGAAITDLVYAPAPSLPLLSAEAKRATIEVAGTPRTYLVYSPRDLPPHAPLLIVLHGLLMDGKLMREWTGYEFDTLADKSEFAVVYPDGIKRNWNGCLADPFPFRSNADDVSFIRAIVANLAEVIAIDMKRVYVMGYSDGGDFAIRLLADAPEIVAGVAVVGMGYPEGTTCRSMSSARPVMLVSGLEDPLVPFEGGQIGPLAWNRACIMSAKRSAEMFAVRNGISEEAATVEAVPTDPGDSVMKYTWSDKARSPVVLYTVKEAGHVVPVRNFRFPRILGRTPHGFDMPSETIEFFGL